MNRYAVKALLPGLLFLIWSGTACAELADRDKPIHMESDRVFIDDSQQTSEFEGRVQLTQGTLSIVAEKIVVTQDAKGYKHCIATGKLASFRQKREGTDEYMEGYGERIEYDTRAETVDLFGSARVRRDQDDVQGDHIAYNTRTEVFRVVGTPGLAADSPTGGRVRAVLQPKDKDASTPAASANDPLVIQPSTTLSNKP
ncbi:MAG: lipopolysaccharide transport periplasmic protein LptA [Gammaproteobacteria bacterium]|nr:lipopolysaccharide transport periplasmic protein LptA [Gammaproteobacteria bacterium]MBU1968970.1 lipopolysaccharide transport periplasmic protein LptA [Gammaproteobacteria bacterium]